MFRQSNWLRFKFFLLLALSIVLMAIDSYGFHSHRLRTTLLAIVAPIQYSVSWPVEFVDWIMDNVSRQQDLIEENATLRAQTMMLQGRLQQILVLQKENTQLRALLQSTAKRKEKFTIAQMLAVTTDPYMARLIIDKGARDHIYEGQPVLDAKGVMGQVVEIGPLTSQVMLITDLNSAIPVQIYRNGLRAIAVGLGSGRELALMNFSNQADIKQGDMVVTSGLGLRYPEGYPVGIVAGVKRKKGKHVSEVLVKPSAGLLQSRQVLLVWQKAQASNKAIQEEVYSVLEKQDVTKANSTRGSQVSRQ